MIGNDGRVREESLSANLAVVNRGLGRVPLGSPGPWVDAVRSGEVEEERPPLAGLVAAAGDVAGEDAAAAVIRVLFLLASCCLRPPREPRLARDPGAVLWHGQTVPRLK